MKEITLPKYDNTSFILMTVSDFPKLIVEVRHVNRCKKLPISATTSPSAAKEYFLQEFSEDLKSVPLKPMVGSPMRIHLKDGAVPSALHTPRQIPLTFRDQVKEALDSMVFQGILKPTGDDLSEWYHPLVVVAKDITGVCITIDLSKLNSQVSRPAHPSPTPFTATHNVDPKAWFFMTADALCGYWQTELAKEDQHLTTFITLYGRFKCCRGRMGFAATGDTFCLWGDMALQGVKTCVKVADDILLHDKDYQSHLYHIHKMLTSCHKFEITLNKHTSLWLLHLPLSSADTCSQENVSAIRDFPTPANLTYLRSFMDPVNQLAEFTPDIVATAQPLCPLMSPKRTFVWTPDHDDHGSGRLRLVQCGSRFLTDTEARYATIELKMLAMVWIRDELYADGDLVLHEAGVIVPAALHCRTLSHLHDSYRGVESTKHRARQAVFWLGINSDVVNTIGACESCQVLHPTQQQEPLMNDENPMRAFESVSADFFAVTGKGYLVIFDQLSGWPVVVLCKGDTTASNIIRIFCHYFWEVDVPLHLRTDGGPVHHQ
ncbi:uncharacterized protein K02A2.6-like [Macrobrachium nipponense]|uniref:uncharacterized protein K02A2.6-like n=1 Tax=Macrobrachium nipponense TaxID=159736 RepID=UPI0030C893E2